MEKTNNMFKKITAAVLAVLLAAPTVFAAASIPSKFIAVSASSVNASATLATTAANAPGSVIIRNDGAVTVYVDFDKAAVAAASTTVPVGPCEVATVSFNGNRPLTAQMITSSGTSSVRVLAVLERPVPPAKFSADKIVSYDAIPNCSTSLVGLSTVNGASFVPYVDSEQITLNTGGLTTDSSANLLHANSMIDAVVCRQTTAITTSTNWGISDPTTANRFAAAVSIATTTLVGFDQNLPTAASRAASAIQDSAAKLRITVTASNPGAGVVRCTVFGRTATVPAS